jgi:hypothetical protein
VSNPAYDLKTAFLEQNLDALAVCESTRRLIRAAEPAELVEVEPGCDVVRNRNGNWLDVPERSFTTNHEGGPVVVLGLGAGHAVRAVRSEVNAPVVVFEPDPGVARAFLERGPVDIGDVELVCSLSELGRIWAGVSHGESAATLVRTAGYSEAFRTEAGELDALVRQLVGRTGMNQNTHRDRARTWVEHLLANVELLPNSAPFLALAGKYRGVPAFICGAGPSLNQNVELLHEARKKGLVIAVNSSAKALAAANVEPQVLCCIESIDVSHLLAQIPFVDRVIRAFSLSASPKTLRAGKGPLLPIWEALPEIAQPLEELTGLPGLAVCGSVSTIAFSLAYHLGCSPIVLVGHDLAFTGNKAYAANTFYERSEIKVVDGRIDIDWAPEVHATRAGGPKIHESEPLEQVPAWGGTGHVPTGPMFSAVRQWLSDAAHTLASHADPVELVNATEGGSHIAGWTEKTLSEVLEPLAARDITAESIVERAHTEFRAIGNKKIQRWAGLQRASVEAVKTAATQLRTAAEKALRSFDADPKEVARCFDNVEAAESRLQEAVAGCRSVDAWAYAGVDRAAAKPAANDGDARREAASGLENEIAVAKSVEQAASELARAYQHIQETQTFGSKKGELVPCPS